MYRCALLLALVAGVYTAQTFEGQCETMKGMDPFDPAKFSGDWYYISGPDHPIHHKDEKCMSMHFTVMGDGHGVNYNITKTALTKDNKKVHYTGLMQTNKPGLKSMGVAVMKSEEKGTWSEVIHFNIIGTDYDHYMVIAGCCTKFDPIKLTFTNTKVGHIWGRKKTLNADVLKTLTNQLAGMNIDTTKFKLRDQSCPAH